MFKKIEDRYIDPMYEMDVFVGGKLITSDKIRLVKRDVKKNISEQWGYRENKISVIRYPRITFDLDKWEIESIGKMGRVYVHPHTGEKRLIKGREHGTDCFYKWRVSLAIFYFRFTGILNLFLPKQWFR